MILRNARCNDEDENVLFDIPRFGKDQFFFFLEGSHSSTVCPSGNSDVQMKMSMEKWQNDTERG